MVLGVWGLTFFDGFGCFYCSVFFDDFWMVWRSVLRVSGLSVDVLPCLCF